MFESYPSNIFVVLGTAICNRDGGVFLRVEEDSFPGQLLELGIDEFDEIRGMGIDEMVLKRRFG